MIGALIGTGITALGSFLGKKKQAQTSQSNVDKTIEANRRMKAMEFERNREMADLEWRRNKQMSNLEWDRNKQMSEMEFGRNLKMSDHQFDQNKQMSEYEFQQNRQMADEAHKRDIEQWERQMQYNSPEQQMERFSEAGLNPHLIYGQGTPGNVSSHPTYQAPQYNAASYDAPRYDAARYGAPEYDAASYQAPTEDYSYRADTSGAAALQELGRFQDFQKKEQMVKQETVKAWLDENTKFIKEGKIKAEADKAWEEATNAWLRTQINELEVDKSKKSLEILKEELALKRVKKKIETIKASFWEKGISPSDSTWIRAGLSALKVLGVSQQTIDKMVEDIPKSMFKSIMLNQ